MLHPSQRAERIGRAVSKTDNASVAYDVRAPE
jgi:hypothetical protein